MQLKPRTILAAIVILADAPAAAQNPTPTLQHIGRDRLCVTNGAVSWLSGDRLSIETPSSRAIVQRGMENAADQIAEIRFQYLGPSQDSKPLASGELRRQIGLKLRAQDTCNLIYAMWHIEPDSRVAVSVKQNPGWHTHEQCGAHGYINFKSQQLTVLSPMRAGESHTLRAELHGGDLSVLADGKLAWQGSLGSDAALPAGPPGFRTDNARFALDYFAGGSAKSPSGAAHSPAVQAACEMSEGD